MMKKYFCGLFLITLAVFVPAHAQILITDFGSIEFNSFNVSTDFISPWTGTQNSTTVSVSNVSNQSGGIYDTLGTSVNIIGSTASLQLTGILTGATPSIDQFQITLYDSSFNSLSYNFNWSSFASGPQTIYESLAASSGIFGGSVSSWQLSTFGSPGDAVSFTFDKMYAISSGAVPEPSTYLFLALGMGSVCLFRRRKLAKS